VEQSSPSAALSFGLSKSRIAAYERCPRRLWLLVHRPDRAEADGAADVRLAESRYAGIIARTLLEGKLVVTETGLATAEAQTRELIAAKTAAIFEATISHDGVLIQADILEHQPDDSWRLIEVKSSTSAKDEHIADVATQLWVLRQSGFEISGAIVRHVNNAFVLAEGGAHEGLFADVDVMARAAPISDARGQVIKFARETLGGSEPTTAMGKHCDQPATCEFHSHCTAQAPPGPEWSVSVLPRGGGNAWLKKGILDLLKVPGDGLTNPVHVIVHRATVTGEPHHDVQGACGAVAAWAYPRAWLDFETIAFAVPRWVGTRPYEQIPFQFSCHLEQEDGSLAHVDFLSLDGSDPRRPCAEALIRLVPASGAVVAYNAPFERSCIIRLAEAFPDLRGALEDLASRVVDLLPVTRDAWYHRDQRGSWSIKAVLPTIAADLCYDDLAVGDGNAAQAAYVEAISPDTLPERREGIATALREYCARDTLAMIVVCRHLCGQPRP
jgi:CRISPR/Cas system-associated exonuclease Cas4 (RecB family)